MEIECIILTTDLNASSYLVNYALRIEGVTIKAFSSNARLIVAQLVSQSLHADILIFDLPLTEAFQYAYRTSNLLQVIIVADDPMLAAKAYDTGVLDYLIKPVTFERFLQSINRAKNIIQIRTEIPLNRIAIRNADSNEINYFPIKDILYIEARINQSLIYTGDKGIRTNVVLNEILNQLGPGFCRVHRSYAVNLGKTTRLSGNVIMLEGGVKIPLGRNYRKAFVEKFRS